MNSRDPIKNISVEQIENAIAEALEKLSGHKHDVEVANISFDENYRSLLSSKMTIYFSKTWLPTDDPFATPKNAL